VGNVGNCFVDPGEECDDCNMQSGDGCDGSGQIEDGWECATAGEACLHVSGFETSTESSAGTIGTNDVTPFSMSCPEGTAFVGVVAEDASSCGCGVPSGQLGSARFLCGAVEVRTTGAYGWSGTPSGLTRVGGELGVGSELGTLTCAQDEFLVGLRATIGATYDELTTVQIECAPFTFVSSVGGGAVERGAVTPSSIMGGGSATSTATCPDGELVTSIDGMEAALIDRFEPFCASMIPTFCGDGNQDPHETCDDGNPVPGDGCDALCQTE
jgi:cysteine-rich repeat protein